MESFRTPWTQHVLNLSRAAFWLLLVFVISTQLFSCGGGIEKRRAETIGRFEGERKTRVIVLVHRQESAGFLGGIAQGSISVDDSEAVLRAIRLTPPDQPIDIILHTPGGLVLAAEQIAKALVDRKAKVTVFVPHYAMSGGTLIALAADEVVMDSNAVLGPVDPQIGDMPAASIIKAVQIKGPQRVDDEILILADIAEKARNQVGNFVANILLKQMPEKKAIQVATILTEGRWTHDFPITVDGARSLGLKVSTEMPRTVYDLMDLYPQTGGLKPSVWYVPMRRPTAPTAPGQQPTTPAQGQEKGAISK